LWNEVSMLAETDGITVLLTTHYLEEADRLARRLAIVDRGRLVVEGTPEQLKGELFGDAIHIDLFATAPEPRVLELCYSLNGISEVVLDGRQLRARAQQGATAVPSLLAALEGDGIRVASVRVNRPSLDDVYLRHTGRSFSQADQETAK
jgi:ABC-2 type transport system ATP-binding protein